MVTARSAAMAFNRLVDHRNRCRESTDGPSRHLPAGVLSRRSVGVLHDFVFAWEFVASNVFVFLAQPDTSLYASLPVQRFCWGTAREALHRVGTFVVGGAVVRYRRFVVWVAIRGQFFGSLWGIVHIPILLAGGVAFWWRFRYFLYAVPGCGFFDRDAGLSQCSEPIFGMRRADCPDRGGVARGDVLGSLLPLAATGVRLVWGGFSPARSGVTNGFGLGSTCDGSPG